MENEIIKLADGTEIKLSMFDTNESYERVAECLVDYIQQTSLSTEENQGVYRAHQLINQLVTDGAIKPSLAIQLIQIADNPTAKVKITFKMNEKYYTPELEEFHVGFEYEQIIKGGHYKQTDIDEPTNIRGMVGPEWIPDNTETWTKKIVSIETFDGEYGDISEYDFKNKRIRVKYLDSSDIEELGWKYLRFDEANKDIVFTKPIPNSEREYLLFFQPPSHVLIRESSFTHTEGCILIPATIKNKSELKTLLKQIGI